MIAQFVSPQVLTIFCIGFPLIILFHYFWYQNMVENTNQTIEIYSKYKRRIKKGKEESEKTPPSLSFSQKKSLSLYDKVSEVMKKVPFYPSFYVLYDYHGYLQTGIQFTIRNLSRIYLQLRYKAESEYFIDYQREIIKLPDNGTVAIDWVIHCQHTEENASGKISTATTASGLEDNRPILIIHHGLTGDSQSEYIYHLLYKLKKLNVYSKIGIMIARGCGGLPLTSFTTFSGRRSYDLFYVIKYLKMTFPENKLFWMGFSLGAAITLHYLEDFPEMVELEEAKLGRDDNDGELSPINETKSMKLDRKQHSCGLDAALCVSPPWNLDRQSLGMNLWSILMIIPLKLYLLQHLENFRKFNPFTGNPEIKHLTLSKLLRMIDINELDRFCYRFYGAEIPLEHAKETLEEIEFHKNPNASLTAASVSFSSSSSGKETAETINPHIHIRYKNSNQSSSSSSKISNVKLEESHPPLTTTEALAISHAKESEISGNEDAVIRNFDKVKATIQYNSLEEYYKDTSPKYRAHQITTPTLAISSRDDPICAHWECPKKPEEVGPGLVVVRSIDLL